MKKKLELKETPTYICVYCGTITTNKVGYGIFFEFFDEPFVFADEFFICKTCSELNFEPFKNVHFTVLKNKACYEVVPKQEQIRAPKKEEMN